MSRENELRNVCEFEIHSTKVSEILPLEVQCQQNFEDVLQIWLAVTFTKQDACPCSNCTYLAKHIS